MDPDAVAKLCNDYQAGLNTRQLAQQYSIGKTAVIRLLRQHGVRLRHQGLDDDQLGAAVRLYDSGHSVVQVADALGLHPSSIYDALKRFGVSMRDPHQPGSRG